MKKFLIICLLTASALAGWFYADSLPFVSSPSPELPVPSSPDINQDSGWSPLSASISRRDLTIDEPETTYKLLIYKFSPDDIQGNIHLDKNGKSLDDWKDTLNADIIINGAYFDEMSHPTGYFQIDGETISYNPYDSALSAALYMDGSPQIVSGPIEPYKGRGSLLQSFPVLILNGKPNIAQDSNKSARRTVIAEANDGSFYIIIVDQTPITLYRLMEVLLNTDLQIDIALNLDGGPSTGLISTAGGETEKIIPLTLLPEVISFSEHRQD